MADKFEPIPQRVRDTALDRVRHGERPSTVAKAMGINPTTIYRWMKKDGVERGEALKPEVGHIYDTPDAAMEEFKKELQRQDIDKALAMFTQMQDGVEERYRVLMAQQLYQTFYSVMANPPRVKNVGDLQKLHQIMKDVLKWDESKSGGRTRLDIQFEVVNNKPTILDAEEVTEPTPDDEDPQPDRD